jgi:hypothetical protein
LINLFPENWFWKLSASMLVLFTEKTLQWNCRIKINGFSASKILFSITGAGAQSLKQGSRKLQVNDTVSPGLSPLT